MKGEKGRIVLKCEAPQDVENRMLGLRFGSVILLVLSDGELNTVKFTIQYQDRRTYLPTDYLSVDHGRIFTEQFDPSFQ